MNTEALPAGVQLERRTLNRTRRIEDNLKKWRLLEETSACEQTSKRITQCPNGPYFCTQDDE